MKHSVVLQFVVLLVFCLAVEAQDFSRLQKIADGVKNQAETLRKSASRRLDRNKQNSTAAIEQAFLAEQFYGAAKLMKKIVGDKYDIGDLRLAGNVLATIAAEFPKSGNGAAVWSKTREMIEALVFELARPADDVPLPVANEKFDESKILGKFFWNGEVDAEVQLTVKGTAITSRTVTGKTLPDGAYSFTSALPRRNGLTVGVKTRDGRGPVEVVRQPDSGNDFTAVIRIRDPRRGAGAFSLEIYWY